MPTTKVTDATFDTEVLQSEQPVLVDFWATWCGPCRSLGPVLEELSDQLDGQLRIAKVDTDANPQVTARYGITSIPAMYLFQNGEVVKTLVGAMAKPKILKELEPFIG